MDRKSLSYRFWLFLICALCSLAFIIRISGPTDLESYAQVLNIGYILDLMTQGHWLVQYDLESAIMSKPPLHTWLMAPFTALFGLNRLALALPSFLSILGLALLLLETGRRRFGLLAGAFAALAIVLAPTTVKQIALIRTDPLFTLSVAAAALAAFYAWERGAEGRKAWLAFWFLAALTTLIKGPLGVVLAAGGLLSHFWEKRSNPAQAAPRGPHLPGIVLFLALTAGWFVTAWISEGQALINKMLHAELIGHAVGEHRGGWQATDLLKPTFFLLVRYLPFSLAVFYGLWRVLRHPASAPGERLFERFLCCWILLGLLIFSLAKHQRADHLLPLWPACALLAGRELARLAERIGHQRAAIAGLVIGALLVGSSYFSVHASTGKREDGSDYNKEMRLARDAQHAAQAFIASGLDASQLHHVDTPISLQLYLGTFRQFVSRQKIEALLANSKSPVNIALGASRIEDLGLSDRYHQIERTFRWPTDESRNPVFQVYRVTP